MNLSAAGADPDSPGLIARWHGEIEKHVEDSGLRYTHLRPVSYMQNLLEQADSIRVDGVVAQAIPQDAPINMIDTRDIAVVAATVLTENGHEGKKVQAHWSGSTHLRADRRDALGSDWHGNYLSRTLS